jgi:hypothetical protein
MNISDLGTGRLLRITGILVGVFIDIWLIILIIEVWSNG